MVLGILKQNSKIYLSETFKQFDSWKTSMETSLIAVVSQQLTAPYFCMFFSMHKTEHWTCHVFEMG